MIIPSHWNNFYYSLINSQWIIYYWGLLLSVSRRPYPARLTFIFVCDIDTWCPTVKQLSVTQSVVEVYGGLSFCSSECFGWKGHTAQKGLRDAESWILWFFRFFFLICQWKCTVFQSVLYFHLIRSQTMHREDKKANLLVTHLWVLSPASRWLHGVRSLDNLLRRGGGLVRGVVWTLLHHVLTLLALWCGRARAFTQDWWAGGRALVWVTGSAKKKTQKNKKREKEENSFQCDFYPHNTY